MFFPGENASPNKWQELLAMGPQPAYKQMH
jgi:hypothetical protein